MANMLEQHEHKMSSTTEFCLYTKRGSAFYNDDNDINIFFYLCLRFIMMIKIQYLFTYNFRFRSCHDKLSHAFSYFL